MRKLRLDADALRVDSFALPSASPTRGTVRGASEVPTFRFADYTCGISCVNRCQHTLEVPGCGIDTDFGCV